MPYKQEKLKIKPGDPIKAETINKIIDELIELKSQIESVRGIADENEFQIEQIKQKRNEEEERKKRKPRQQTPHNP